MNTLRYTLTDYTYKYCSDRPAPIAWGQTHIELLALRNEMAACQLLLEPAETVLATLGRALHFRWQPGARLRVEVGELRSVEGDVLLGGEVQACFVGTVPVDGEGTRVADPLLRQESILIPAGRVQAIWLSLRVPKQARPGRYVLPLTLYYAADDFLDEEIAGQAEVTLEVAALVLPDPAEFRHFLDLWQHPTGIARGHGVPLWSEEHWRLIEAYGRELARLGQKAITIIASDSPWAGQRCRGNPEYPSALHEYNMVGISRGRDGKLHFDFSRMDRYVETYLRLGINKEIEVLGLLAAWDDDFGRPLQDHPDNIRLACRDEATGRITWLRTQAELREYMGALAAHLQQRGWWELTRFTADEPSDVALFRQRVDFLHSACPGAQAKIPFYHTELMGEFLQDVADWVPVLHGLARDVETSRRLQAAVQARGDRFLWYVCCGPKRPNNFITSPAIEARFQGWFTAWAGLDGFLRWAFTCWPADPWGQPYYRIPHWPAGDMFFVYPGGDGQPVRSLRTETLLLGIQDFELVALARAEAERRPEVRAAIEQAFARIVRADLAAFAAVNERAAETLYSLAPEDYEAARRGIIEAMGR